MKLEFLCSQCNEAMEISTSDRFEEMIQECVACKECYAHFCMHLYLNVDANKKFNMEAEKTP